MIKKEICVPALKLKTNSIKHKKNANKKRDPLNLICMIMGLKKSRGQINLPPTKIK
jgi:hypothetical protein